MTLTGIRKHVDVLEAAGLVTTEKVGRVRQVPARHRAIGRRHGVDQLLPATLGAPTRRPRGLLHPHPGDTKGNEGTNHASDIDTSETLELRMTRTLPATPEEVFDAYTDAEKQKIWFSILDEEPGIVEIEVDLRVGGNQVAVWAGSRHAVPARSRRSSRSTARTGSSPSRRAATRAARR